VKSPPKEKPLLGGEGLHKRIKTGYAVQRAFQLAWIRWQRQAAIFIAEFFRTGDERHLSAFCKHITAMRAHLAGATQ